MTFVDGAPTYADARAGAWPHASKALLIVRVVVGSLFVGHGCQKLFGWFGGKGFDDFAGSLGKAGVQATQFWAYFEASAEVAAGLCLVLGLLTPLVAAVLVGDMVVAALKVHLPNGLWSQAGGYEYNLVLVAVLLAVGLAGAGRYALDNWLGIALPRPHTFLAALALAVLAAAALVLGLV